LKIALFYKKGTFGRKKGTFGRKKGTFGQKGVRILCTPWIRPCHAHPRLHGKKD
jgi:hypothetical protein